MLPTSFRINEYAIELYFQEIRPKRAAIVIRTCGGPGASIANWAAAHSARTRRPGCTHRKLGCRKKRLEWRCGGSDRYQRMAARVVVVQSACKPLAVRNR